MYNDKNIIKKELNEFYLIYFNRDVETVSCGISWLKFIPCTFHGCVGFSVFPLPKSALLGDQH